MGFKEILKNELSDVLSGEDLSLLPRGFQALGDAMILKLDEKLNEKKFLIGKACINLFPHFKSVYINLGKIIGNFRKPEKIEFLVGENNPIVELKEHGIIYRFNLTKIMFSKGNINERRYLATLVKENEIIVDMFAGIGYFSLPITKHAKPAKIYAIELNPESYKFLVENIKLNHVEDIIIPIQGDCKEEVVKLSKSGIQADRVIMGIFPAPKDYVKDALKLVTKNGTYYHYEGVVDNKNYGLLYEEFKEIASKEEMKCELISKRFVKSYGPNLNHCVIDIFVSKR